MKIYHYNCGRGSNPEWGRNWGDIIAPSLIKGLGGGERPVTNDRKGVKFVSIGSVMSQVGRGDWVWGTGSIELNERLDWSIADAEILAVRGPRTRERLIRMGLDVPSVFGDPALLAPLVWDEEVSVTHDWGIIPHYIDLDNPLIPLLEQRGVKLVNILAGEDEFVRELRSCQRVVSSSLHGLIAADAWGIPNARIILSDRIRGGDFKFIDYAESVNRKDWEGARITDWQGLNSLDLNTKIDWDPEPLIESAPWNNKRLSDRWFTGI